MGDKYFKDKYRIDSVRLKYWDYGNPGYYFVTICVKGKVCSFGDIKNGSVCLSGVGQVAYNCWLEIPKHFPFVELHDFVIMPNHVHGIIFIGGDKQNVETRFIASPDEDNGDSNIKYNDKECGSAIIDGETNIGCRKGDAINRASTRGGTTGKNNPMGKRTLGEIVRWYKGRCSYEINQKIKSTDYFIWQPRFHDRIIRNEYEMYRIKEYIKNNPTNWDKDIFFYKS